MAGMIDESLDETLTGAPWEFASKPVWQKFIVIAAGSVMNFITAIIIFAIIALSNGVPSDPSGAQINEVLADTPAAQSGLLAGDVITLINGQSVKTSQDLIEIVNANAEVALPLQVERNGELIQTTVTPALDQEKNVGLIGVQVGTRVDFADVNLAGAIAYGASYSYKVLGMVVDALGKIVTGQESLKDSVGGPIIIAKMAGESAKHGFEALLGFTAFISLNLGFFNLLPFPVLDGGHLVVLLIEGVTRREIPVKAKILVQKVGMALLLALMIFIIFNDISRWNNLGF
jgi:regulator of sigma E protease